MAICPYYGSYIHSNRFVDYTKQTGATELYTLNYCRIIRCETFFKVSQFIVKKYQFWLSL